MTNWIRDRIDAVYVLAVSVFILGLKAMSGPETARRGIVQAGAAMLIAVVVTFLVPRYRRRHHELRSDLPRRHHRRRESATTGRASSR